MERKDFIELGQRTIADFVSRAPGKSVATTAIRMTSGTSGTGPLMVVTQTDVVQEGRHYSDAANVLSAFIGTRSTRLKQALILRRTGPERRRLLALDGKDITPRLDALLEQFAPEAIIGFPTNVASVTPHILAPVRDNIKVIVTSGEQVGGMMKQYLQEQFAHARIGAFYGTAETSEIAGHCPYNPLTVYHPSPGVLVEIDQPDENGIGDILVTKTIYPRQKADRYRTGDVGKMIDGVCRCGALVSFNMIGRRGYDFIRVQGLHLLKEEFDRVALSLNKYISDYRAEAYTTGTGAQQKGGIVLSVYRKSGILSRAEIEKVRMLFAERLYVSASLTLADATSKGSCVPLEVIAVPEPFPKQHKDITLTLRPS
jgi:phenylacetate-coenzyme A ligase PaaK-like adenylate-forming protein